MEEQVKIVVMTTEAFRRAVKSKAALAGMTVSEALRALLQAWIDGKIELPGEDETRT